MFWDVLQEFGDSMDTSGSTNKNKHIGIVFRVDNITTS
jgi:hypothetical protein